MDAKKYRDALAKLDLTQAAAGTLFGVGDRTSRRWALGGARVPPSVAMVLQLMLRKRLDLEVEIPASAARSPERRVWSFSAKEAVHAME